MKKLWAMLVVASLGMILAVGDRASAALPCPAGCGGQKNACVQAARVAKLSCKQDCRTNADPTTLGACMRTCSGTFRSTKTRLSGRPRELSRYLRAPVIPTAEQLPRQLRQGPRDVHPRRGEDSEDLRGGMPERLGPCRVSQELYGRCQARCRDLRV